MQCEVYLYKMVRWVLKGAYFMEAPRHWFPAGGGVKVDGGRNAVRPNGVCRRDWSLLEVWCRAGTYAARPYREGDGELGGGDLAD